MPYNATQIEDCEDTWNEIPGGVAGVTLGTDPADYKEGTASATFGVTGAVTAATLLATESIGPLDLSACHRMRLWILCDLDAEAGDLYILLSAVAFCAVPLETLAVPALTAGTWAYMTVALANPALLTAIISVGLYYATKLGACNIKIDAVYGDELLTEFQKREIARLSPRAVTQFTELLSRVTEMNQDTGFATGGSNTTLEDTVKSWETNKWKDGIIEFYDVDGEIYYFATIISNTADTITCGAFGGAASPAAGDPYGIRMAVRKVGHDITDMGDGRQVVGTAGTRVALAASTAAKIVIITAELDNTQTVVVGGVTCVAALATRRGTPLNPGDSATYLIDNLADVYVDSLVNGEGVSYTYLY